LSGFGGAAAGLGEPQGLHHTAGSSTCLLAAADAHGTAAAAGTSVGQGSSAQTAPKQRGCSRLGLKRPAEGDAGEA
jgi:hypothetical protein